MIKEKKKPKKPELLYEKLFNLSLIPTVVLGVVTVLLLIRVAFIYSDYEFAGNNDEFYLAIVLIAFLISFKTSHWLYHKWQYLTYKEIIDKPKTPFTSKN